MSNDNNDKLLEYLTTIWVATDQSQMEGLSKREILLGLISTVFKVGQEYGMPLEAIDRMIRHVRVTYGVPPHEQN